jgi:hypothetical protein
MDGSGGISQRQIRLLQFDDGFCQWETAYISS